MNLRYPRLTCSLFLGALSSGCGVDSEKAQPVAWFTEVDQESGIQFKHVAGDQGDYYLPEIMGSGVALFDADGDQDIDLYFIQSGSLKGASVTHTNELYLNDGYGHFLRTSDSGLESAKYGMGVTTGDFDDDGLVDVYVTNVGPNELFKNVGNGQFIDVTEQAGVGHSGFGTATLFLDFDQDGDLDLFVANYVDWSVASEIKCYDSGTGVRNYCDPGNYSRPTADVLYRNNSDGTFTDVSELTGIASAQGNGLGAVATDFNQDGAIDIFVANDKTPNHLWMNQAGHRFENQAFARNAAMDDYGMAKAGMGVVATDLDRDLDMDLVVVNIETETDSVFRNEIDYFVDATANFQLHRHSRKFTRFGVAIADFNGDGSLDILQANGRVLASPESEVGDPYAERNLLIKGLEQSANRVDGSDGTVPSPHRFSDVSNITSDDSDLIHTSRALAIADLNGDQWPDVVVTNRNAAPYLLINQNSNTLTTDGNAVRQYGLEIELLKDEKSADLNARVEIEDVSTFKPSPSILAEVQVSGSYLSAHSSTVRLSGSTLSGFDEKTKLSIYWSDGTSDSIEFDDLPRRIVYQKGVGPISD